MADYQTIYRERAEEYDLLVTREDYQGSLLRAIEAACPIVERDVVEFGAGTGRLTRLLLRRARSIRAFDASEAMLAVARRRLSSWADPERTGARSWELEVGMNDALPCNDAIADVAIAGWTFGHMMSWFPADWPARVDRVLAEMRRVTRPGGHAIILETLGTGREDPQPPTPALADYYALLETRYGFARNAIRTDYAFDSPEEAERLTRFFFGDTLADHVKAGRLRIVPECTGVWSRRW